MHGVIPCLSTGSAKNDKIMSMFVLFSGFLVILKVWLFSKMERQTLHQAVKHDILVNL